MSDPTRRESGPAPGRPVDVQDVREAMEGLREASRRLEELEARPPSPTRDAAIRMASDEQDAYVALAGLGTYFATSNAKFHGRRLDGSEARFLTLARAAARPNAEPGYVPPTADECAIVLTFAPDPREAPTVPTEPKGDDDRRPTVPRGEADADDGKAPIKAKRKPTPGKAAKGDVEPGARALSAAYQLSRNGKPVSVRAACKLAGVDRENLRDNYPEAQKAIEAMSAPDRSPRRGVRDRRTGDWHALDSDDD